MGGLGLQPDCCRLHRKKGYFSRARRAKIKFDISIEVFLPNADKYSLVFLIECKDYGHSVPVDDAEEFFAKVEQVGGANAKGVIVSTAAFQSGTVEFCDAKGIGLLRYFDRSHLKWVLHRSPSTLGFSRGYTASAADVFRGLTVDSYQSRCFDFYCASGSAYTNSLAAFLRMLGKGLPQVEGVWHDTGQSPESARPLVPHANAHDIEARAQSVLTTVHYLDGAVDLDAVCSWQAGEADLKVRRACEPPGHSGSSILGRINFRPLEIETFKPPEETPEIERFTLAHELGHHFLGHSRYMAREECEAPDFVPLAGGDFALADIHRLEWQANYFASCLLLPRESFVREFCALAGRHGLRDRGFGLLYVDQQPCNRAVFTAVVLPLARRFKVSRTVAKIRLEGLGVLKDDRRGDSARAAARPLADLGSRKH